MRTNAAPFSYDGCDNMRRYRPPSQCLLDSNSRDAYSLLALGSRAEIALADQRLAEHKLTGDRRHFRRALGLAGAPQKIIRGQGLYKARIQCVNARTDA